MTGPRILVDLASLDRVAARPLSRHSGGTPWALGSAATERRRNAPLDDAARAFELDQSALPTVGRLAREGRLELCSYEGFSTPDAAPSPGSLRELLGTVPVTTIAPALQRSVLGEDVYGAAEQSGALARLCARLKSADPSADGEVHAHRGSGPAADEAAAPTERYRQLAARVQGHHLADLFHLWTGEVAGCRYWLTLDDTLGALVRDRVAPHLAAALGCEPIRPDRLLDSLGVVERDRRPVDAVHVTRIGGKGPPP